MNFKSLKFCPFACLAVRQINDPLNEMDANPLEDLTNISILKMPMFILIFLRTLKKTILLTLICNFLIIRKIKFRKEYHTEIF